MELSNKVMDENEKNIFMTLASDREDASPGAEKGACNNLLRFDKCYKTSSSTELDQEDPKSSPTNPPHAGSWPATKTLFRVLLGLFVFVFVFVFV